MDCGAFCSKPEVKTYQHSDRSQLEIYFLYLYLCISVFVLLYFRFAFLYLCLLYLYCCILYSSFCIVVFMYLYFGICICVLFEPGGKDISRRPFTALRTDLCSRDLMFGSLGLDWAPSVLQIDFDVKENSVEIY